ncbi:MAG: NUDIX hydrolase, partial [Planctomycetes bacterium]|nr:NUDIX hydrolase [Planctomycetota bacterium]
RLEDNERITVAPVDTQEVWEMLAGGELRDAKTIATLAVYFARTRG